MSLLERLLSRLLATPIDAAVQRALAEHLREQPHNADPRAAPDGYAVHGDPTRLHLHSSAVVNDALFNVSSGEITVERDAFFGHGVSILTGTHDVTKFGRERRLAIPRGGRDVVVGEGAWLASHVLVLGPSVIGAHAVVAAGSLVRGDVGARTIVAGRPARVVRTISADPADPADPAEPADPKDAWKE